ncbi:hypothetical protein MTR67_023599 [Solanum verrucosum]|uniref:Uncharacterized protein n=1 Tax=Solanum verrucosum TaxID=315347 RepID=A0AAF0R267_SOLVR|nr:hypothetical protein MTR67_023599 [Solanum verrucosum]
MMQKMEKQMEEQKKTVRQEVIADVIAQLKHAGLIDPNILAALSIPSPSEPTSVQGAEQETLPDFSRTELVHLYLLCFHHQ